MSAMLCYRCKGGMVSQRVRFQMTTDQGLVFVEGVPARVCPQCGERIFSVDVMRRLERLRQRIQRGDVSPEPADVKQLVYA